MIIKGKTESLASVVLLVEKVSTCKVDYRYECYVPELIVSINALEDGFYR